MTAFHTVTVDDLSRLISLLEQQLRLFEHLAELSDRQQGLVDDGQAEQLLALLAQRQQLIDHLDTVNGELEPYRNQWDQFWPGLEDSQRQRIGPLIEQAQQLLERIMQADDRDRGRLESAKIEVAAELSQVNQARAARDGYHHVAGSDQNNRFTNRQG